MPIRRNLDPRRFKEEIDECYLTDYKELLRIKFDEEKFCPHIGFFKLKDHLEATLYQVLPQVLFFTFQRFKESMIPTLQLLENLVTKVDNLMRMPHLVRHIKN